MATKNISADIVPEKSIEVDIAEKNLIAVKLTKIDTLAGKRTNIVDFEDMNVSSLAENDILIYDGNYWINTDLPTLFDNYLVIEDATRVTSKKYQASNNWMNSSLRVYVNGLLEKYYTVLNYTTVEFEDAIDSDDIVSFIYIKRP